MSSPSATLPIGALRPGDDPAWPGHRPRFGSGGDGVYPRLGERVRSGLSIRGVPTSEGTAQLARQLGIPLVTLEELDGPTPIDLAVDGADEVDPQLNLVKGLGGALVREKVVAAAARQLVILVGPGKLERKLSPVLGTRGVLPVEVLTFGWGQTKRRLQALGFASASATAARELS